MTNHIIIIIIIIIGVSSKKYTSYCIFPHLSQIDSTVYIN